jgi:hypothetical protein
VAITSLADAACLVVAFYASGWLSGAASAVFIVLTSFTGYKAVQLIRWEKHF